MYFVWYPPSTTACGNFVSLIAVLSCKNSGFEISQNIKIEYIAGEKFDSVIESFGDLISKETLAKTILKVQEIQLSVIEELRLNGEDVVIGLTTLD